MIRFFSWLLIPCATILIPGRTNWLASNFSLAASEAPARYFLIFWGILTGGFFSFLVRRTLRLPSMASCPKTDGRLAGLGTALLFISVLIPYRPSGSRLMAAAHTSLAFLASLLFYTVLLRLSLRLYFTGRSGLSVFPAALFFSALASAALFLLAGNMVSSALEIFVTVFTCCWFPAFYQKAAALPPG